MFSASKTATAASLGPADTQFDYVTLLLNGDGTNGAQNNTFIDSSSNAFSITRNGNTTQGSFSPYGSLWSNYFDGTGYLDTTSSISTGTGDYTWEGWIYYSATDTRTIFSHGDVNNSTAFEFYVTGSGFYIYNSSITPSWTSLTVPKNQWAHFALVRSSGSFKLYLNGVLQTATGTTSSTTNYSGTFRTGAELFNGGASVKWIGYISNLRLNNTAVYTSNFTPSTTPLTAISGTQLLTCQSNRFKDASSNAYSLTVNGNPLVQRFSPFNPTTPYTTATIGGSGYFDGTGDYLNGNLSSFDVSGDFTLECWIYTTTTPGYAGIVNINAYNTGMLFQYETQVGFLFYFLGNSVRTTSIKYNQWTHLAAVRSGSTITVYLNGVADQTMSSSSSFTASTFKIGRSEHSASEQTFGYISDIRFVNGTAVYTGNFTPPTAPLTAISNTQLLTNFTNAGIPDYAMMNDLETLGNAQVSTSVKKFGTGSLYFDGSGDYLYGYNPTGFLFGTGDFTIEAWVYPTSFGSERVILSTAGPTDAQGFTLNIGSGGDLIIGFGAGSWTILTTSGGTLSTNQWQHVALTRSGNNFYAFINGTQTWTDSNSLSLTNTNNAIYVGGRAGQSQYFVGYIDEPRITKGYARYTTTFTPPTTAFPTY